MDRGLVLDWHQASVYISDDHMCTHQTDHVSEIVMTVCVIDAYHMKHIYPDGLMSDRSISSVMKMRMLLSFTNPSMLCMGRGLVPDRQQASVDIHDDLMFTHEISHVSSIEMGVCDTSVIWELIYLDGLMGTAVSPVHLHRRYCSLALGHPYSV